MNAKVIPPMIPTSTPNIMMRMRSDLVGEFKTVASSTTRRFVDFRPAVMPASAQDYTRVRKLLQSKKMYVGTYVSGTSVMPQAKLKKYPRETVSFEQMPSTAHYSRSDAKEAE